MTTRTTSTKTTMTAFYLIGNEDIDNTRPTHQSAQHNNQPYKRGGKEEMATKKRENTTFVGG